MIIQIAQGHQPPPNPDGVTVVIDVIRAFTTSFYAFRGGASRILPVPDPQAAFALRERYPDALLAGEIDALPIEGFQFGNSPWEISQADVSGRTLIMRTTNGVTATLNARPCAALFVAALVNAAATARAIKKLAPEKVVLVASHPTGDEDVACAEYISHLLGGSGITQDEAIARTRNARAAQKFYAGTHPRLRAVDIDMAAQCEAEGFAMRVADDDELTIQALPA